ncbi:hypothetical protein D7Y15_36550 [Corallococcus sp. AB030]|uniref:DUF5953 family protein n=1 Tax=Corallococcus TaxID=83461 RepID=UPI000EA12A32|nr:MULTISPECIES: DUF5953 family protein [Corallococcus]NRD59195.1 hypothetical protein [Corallococcus exiguus]RKH20181.1 hypothetical protein D7V77_31405 [Corallococcus sp. CA041A]RKI01123.1 hypothetical protein D7Y15_36550 [Corallococcus sp. AB030]RUO88752.1 hypothetical protein D7Y11_33795 [Corallococcus sp. AB018]
MTKQRNNLVMMTYAPALVGNDSRPLAVVHGMERAIPGLRLDWAISVEGNPYPLPQRDAWVLGGRPDGPGFPLVCNGPNESELVTVYGLEISADSGPGGQPLFDVHAEMPMNAGNLAAAGNLLEGIAEGARAFWGHATPFPAGVEIARQTKNWAANPKPPPRGLPALKLAREIPSPECPHRLGWLNYWSAATARRIGFPDPVRDTELLSRARRTTTGGWIVRLTEEPLDLDIPTHLETLLRAYERFPAIGGRVPT